MYQFIDVNEVSESELLPSEALSINGEYIENLISGYRTLSVKGREALSAELDSYEMTARDGAKNKSKRYPPRTIVVKYQLITRSATEYREAFNKLGQILSANDATLIFHDEEDKFFIGTVTEIGEVEEGRNAVVGEFEIFCADPFKYSVIEYESVYDPSNKTIFVDYGGTYKSFPKLCADFYKTSDNESSVSSNGECGFIAFFNENEKIIQLGNPDELDSTTTPQATTTLVNSVFDQSGSFGETVKSKWKQNTGITTGSDVVQSGTAGMSVASYETPTTPGNTSGTLLNNKATTQGAPIFYYTVKAKTTGRTSNSVKVKVYETEVDVSKGNKLFKDGVSSVIEKQKDVIIFNVGGTSKRFTDATLKDVPVTEVTFVFATHGTKKSLSCNGLYSVKVIREVSEAVENIKNVFTPNDTVIADCETGNIYRNGALEQNLGALGNDWEDFYLENGMNQIGTAYSDFVESAYAPTFKVKYREVFL